MNNNKKLGICVCYQHRNYGSQLQSYATTIELEKRNIDYEIIRYKKKLTPKLALKFMLRIFNPVFISDRVLIRYQKKLMLKLNPQLGKNNAIRNQCLADFSKEHFTKLSPVYYGYQQLCSESRKYSAVMVGSDQLWAPGGITTNFYNLMFAPKGVKRISYAASYGVSTIKSNLTDIYNSFLTKMDHISVREQSGKQLTKDLSNRDATVVVDPVLLLSKEEWEQLIPNKPVVDYPYIFAYFLGKSPEYRAKVVEFAKEKGLKIVTSHHMDSYNKCDRGFGDYAPYNVGPAEFLNLIRNAEYVFTDSFHGSVFSAIHTKKFMVFDRYQANSVTSKNSRIDSFCQSYNLSDRRFNGDINAVDNPIDYNDVHSKMQDHIRKSKEFLDIALADLT